MIEKKSLAHKIITFSVMLATMMQSLDSTIANVILPHMQGALSATQDQMSWVLTSYIVASAITIPLAGWLAGFLGRKLVFLVSIAGFSIASMLCGMAETLLAMVCFRLLQGIFGAALLPLSQAVLFDINPKEDHGKSMALWGVGVTMSTILAPVLGGWLTENYNWRWAFYINLPISIFAFLGLYTFLPKTDAQKNQFDFFGFFMLSIAVGGFQIFLDRGDLKDWFGSTEIIVESICSGLAFYLFLIHSVSHPKPFLNPALLKDRNFVTGNILFFILGLILMATLALLPPMLQNQLNYPVITAGLAIAPRGMGTMCAMILVGQLITRVDPRFILGSGFLITALSLWDMSSYSLYVGTWPIVWMGCLQGFGIGLCYGSLTLVTFSTLPSILRNEGTSLFNLSRNLGGSIGISIVTSQLVQNTQRIHSELSTHVTPYHMLANQAAVANHIDLSTQTGLISLNHMLTNQAAMIAYIDDFRLLMIITLLVMPCLMLLEKPTQLTEQTMAME